MTARVRHLVSVTGVAVFITLIARPWSGLDTPDSSFYTSLALYGDEVTDRAPFDSYYWTRLGYIGPLRLLTTIGGVFGTPELGFYLYRFLLIFVLVGSIYAILHKLTRSSQSTLIFVTTSVSLSSVILSYFGNPYLTGFILAATTASIATAVYAQTTHISRFNMVFTIAGGVIIGWSAQVNPAGALLVGTLWVAVSIFMRAKFPHYVVAGIAAILTFLFFIALGRFLFPELNWFETFNATREMNLSNFASNTPVWLTDISLLAPLAVVLIAIKSWWVNRDNLSIRLALVISSVSASFLLVFSPLMGGIAMEAPMYQSMLWPPAMIAMALIFSERVHIENMESKVFAILGIAVVITAGFMQPTLTFAVGCAIAVGTVALSVLVNRNAVANILIFVAILASFQLLQNSRGDLGLYYLSPYSWAFQSNPIEQKITTAIEVQDWLLANTTDQDQILTWVDGDWVNGDRELYVVAAMQLWGENRLTLEPTIDEYAKAILERTDPSVIALYGRDDAAVGEMWESIPGAGPLNCHEFGWPKANNTAFPAESGVACLTRLDLP